MLSNGLVVASLNLLKSAVELGLDPAKRTLPGWADVAAKLVSLLDKADKKLIDAPPEAGLLVRRGLVITTLMVRSVREVAPPEAQVDTVPQAVARVLSSFWDKVEDLGKRAIDGGVPASEPSPGAALERALGVVAMLAAADAPDVLAAGVRPAPLTDWLGPPTGTLWYKALWTELTEREKLTQLAWLTTDQERRGVERQFMALWRFFCAGPEGQTLEANVKAAIKSDGANLWDHLARHYAGWGRRHVFGNLSEFNEDEGVVFMPLEDVYVEPWVRQERESRASAPMKALSALRDAASKYRLTVVSGAMGFGKTLTARMLVTEWAKKWRQTEKPLSERWMPVYVSCRERLRRKTELKSLISETVRAYWREISGEDHGKNDARLSQLDGYKLIVVLDGFDEVVMPDAVREDLLAELESDADDWCHIIVFTRPGVVPKLPDDFPKFTVQAFEEVEQDEWLTRWSALKQPGPTRASGVLENLRDLLSTPVLLFMVASSWGEAGGAPQTSAALYERFLRRLARGKLRSEPTQRLSTRDDENPQIVKAGDVVLSHLRDQWKTTHPGEKPTHEDAMLWILGRIALEMHRRGQETGQRELMRQEAHTLISEAIGGTVDKAQLHQITLACVLTTHLGLRDDDEVMFFGHRSFQEFLVARAWREQLRRIASLPAGDERKAEERVLEDLLIQSPEDKTIHFLMELLKAETPAQQLLLKKWAKETVEDPHVGLPFGGNDKRPKAHTDSRAPLALAAFAIGGTLSGEERFVLEGPLPLRRVLAWIWLTQRQVRLVAPRIGQGEGERWSLIHARFSGADLSGIDLRGANLSGADLSDANLRKADFSSANLCRAILSGGVLRGANLSGADLSDADLSGADLSGADLSKARLSDAKLSGAKLSGAHLNGGDLRGADLSGARLSGADLRGANLHRVRLHEANLSNARLNGADLRGADLSFTNATYADFSGANLSDVNLYGARLSSTNVSGATLSCSSLHYTDLSTARNLSTANLRNAQFTLNHPRHPDTRWPPSFRLKAATAAGALPNLPAKDAWPAPHPDPTNEPPPPNEDGDP